MACYDIEGNTVDCTDSQAIGVTSSSGINDVNAGLNLTNNPVAASAGTSNGPSALSQFFGFLGQITPSITKAVAGSSTSSLRLQLNPATGLQQYYNPQTGQYVGAPVSQTGIGGTLGGSSLLLIVFALVIGFFAFSGRKHATA